MFGLSFGEILIILVVALLVLGPTGMPKLARTLGKGLRDFRKATGDIRGAFETEFYKLDQEVEKVAATTRPAPTLESANAPPVDPAEGIVPSTDGAPGGGPREPPEGTAPTAAAMLAAHEAPEGTVPAAPNVAVNPSGEKPAQPGPAGRPADEKA